MAHYLLYNCTHWPPKKRKSFNSGAEWRLKFYETDRKQRAIQPPYCPSPSQQKELRKIGPARERKEKKIMNTERKREGKEEEWEEGKTEINVKIRIKEGKEEGRKNKQRERRMNGGKNER
jgi:hypothetical protein